MQPGPGMSEIVCSNKTEQLFGLIVSNRLLTVNYCDFLPFPYSYAAKHEYVRGGNSHYMTCQDNKTFSLKLSRKLSVKKQTSEH